MNAQKHQKLNVTPSMVSQNSAAATLAAMSAPNYKCITPAHVGEMTKQSVYMLAPPVLALANNS